MNADNPFATAVPGFWAGLEGRHAEPNPHGNCYRRPVRALLGEPKHRACGIKKLKVMRRSPGMAAVHAERIIRNFEITEEELK